MNVLERSELIKEGDIIILFLGPNNIYQLPVTKTVKDRNGVSRENLFNTIYGCLKVFDLVGKPYGHKVTLSKGWGHVLHPSCELWTRSLTHRTQIIYTPDISLIIFGLDLRPGCRVVEAGTGSGSLSVSLIRAVLPTGHLHTFEFHEKRAESAREDFERLGLSKWVTVQHRDVIGDGFGALEEKVDAISLDLPAPWDVVPHVQNVLKKGGKLATFSPCIEQVQKTTETLRDTNSFIMIRTQEVLQRNLYVQNRTLQSINFDPPPPPDSDGKMKPIGRDPQTIKALCTPPQMAGHTGYITFSTFVPN